ncbi:hypothetical protein SAMN05421507_13113 [Lentzea jiangxiensis]|uniref:Uncharacterized protein n=1 Tax=Lentzea jiangxiensis TaxID=641025 RepID=A0A1H0X3C0_9PSEU|nr:hypothetical protein SAMN05421507_13113 [Lentzea jiangxiensis]
MPSSSCEQERGKRKTFTAGCVSPSTCRHSRLTQIEVSGTKSVAVRHLALHHAARHQRLGIQATGGEPGHGLPRTRGRAARPDARSRTTPGAPARPARSTTPAEQPFRCRHALLAQRRQRFGKATPRPRDPPGRQPQPRDTTRHLRNTRFSHRLHKNQRERKHRITQFRQLPRKKGGRTDRQPHYDLAWYTFRRNGFNAKSAAFSMRAKLPAEGRTPDLTLCQCDSQYVVVLSSDRLPHRAAILGRRLQHEPDGALYGV